MILIMYTKKIYTRFYIVWMVDLFFPPKHELYPLSRSHSKSMVLIKKCSHLLGTNVKMSVEFEGKQNTWLKGFFVFLFCFDIKIPVNQRGLKPHTEANRKSRHLGWKTQIPSPPQKKQTTLKCFILGSWQAQVLPYLGFIGRFKSKLKHFEHSSKVKQPKEYCPQTVRVKQIQALS